LERTIAERAGRPDPASGTAKLLADPALLAAKLAEEAAELAQATTPAAVVHEAADLLYLALVALARGGGSLAAVRSELARRHGAVTRRPMTAKRSTER
jgi:phosphoribosyl-ATP pyrophosphohydrolase